jgi:hypothetical protein
MEAGPKARPINNEEAEKNNNGRSQEQMAGSALMSFWIILPMLGIGHCMDAFQPAQMEGAVSEEEMAKCKRCV